MKKMIALLSALLIVLSLFAGCGSTTDEPAADDVFVFTVGFDQEFPPYGFVGDDGEFAGFDLDFAQAQVRLFGKGSKERVVPVYARALDVVSRYLSEARPQLARRKKDDEPTNALFVSTRGNRMTADALRTCFERHVRAAGIDGSVTPHAMRHTYATELLSGGADLRSVQELLGHESLATTQIYTHLSVERLKEATRQAHPRGE